MPVHHGDYLKQLGAQVIRLQCRSSRDIHQTYLSQHFLCKLSALCTFVCTALIFKHLHSVYKPDFCLHYYLHYLHFYLHYLHFYLHCLHFCLHNLHFYLHICLHYLHSCLHCVDFQVVTSVYNPFFVCTTICTAYTVAQPYTCERGARCASEY